MDESGTQPEPDTQVCLQGIKQAFVEVKASYEEVSQMLRRFYGEA